MKKSLVDDRYLARVYLQQARATKHLTWRATLLAWAKKRRVAGRRGTQLDLFGERSMSDPDQMVREVARLTEQQIWDWWSSENGFEDFDLCKINDFRQFVRAVEEKLGAAPAHPAQPVAYSVGRTLHWHEGQGITDAQLYAHPAGDAIRDAALEEAAQECDRQQREEPECPERAEYCADAIRALRGRAG